MSNKVVDDVIYFGDGKHEPTNWDRGALIGRGAFGKVFLAQVRDKQLELAVKKIVKHDDDMKLSVQREVNALKELSHEGIIKYHGCFSNETSIYIFLDYMPAGNLDEYITKLGAFPEIKVKKFTRQMLAAVNYLHERNIFHRDIKSNNFLMLNEDFVKLADFGLSKPTDASGICTSGVGSVRFMAPETLSNFYDKPVDVWAIGCVVLHMVTGQLPHKDLKEQQQILFRLSKKDSSSSPLFDLLGENSLTTQCRVFLEKFFEIEPRKRPSASTLLNYNIFLSDSQPITVVLLGNTGDGKSSTGNTLLGCNLFEVIFSATTIRQGVVDYIIEEDGNIWHIYDTTGFLTTDAIDDEEKLNLWYDELKTLFEMCQSRNEGVTVFLLVFNGCDRFCYKKALALRFIETALGGCEFLEKYCIVVLTNAQFYADEEKEKTMLRYAKVINKCQNRAVLVENAKCNYRYEASRQRLKSAILNQKTSNTYSDEVAYTVTIRNDWLGIDLFLGNNYVFVKTSENLDVEEKEIIRRRYASVIEKCQNRVMFHCDPQYLSEQCQTSRQWMITSRQSLMSAILNLRDSNKVSYTYTDFNRHEHERLKLLVKCRAQKLKDICRELIEDIRINSNERVRYKLEKIAVLRKQIEKEDCGTGLLQYLITRLNEEEERLKQKTPLFSFRNFFGKL